MSRSRKMLIFTIVDVMTTCGEDKNASEYLSNSIKSFHTTGKFQLRMRDICVLCHSIDPWDRVKSSVYFQGRKRERVTPVPLKTRWYNSDLTKTFSWVATNVKVKNSLHRSCPSRSRFQVGEKNDILFLVCRKNHKSTTAESNETRKSIYNDVENFLNYGKWIVWWAGTPWNSFTSRIQMKWFHRTQGSKNP